MLIALEKDVTSKYGIIEPFILKQSGKERHLPPNFTLKKLKFTYSYSVPRSPNTNSAYFMAPSRGFGASRQNNSVSSSSRFFG